jgi:tryptophanase
LVVDLVQQGEVRLLGSGFHPFGAVSGRALEAVAVGVHRVDDVHHCFAVERVGH